MTSPKSKTTSNIQDPKNRKFPSLPGIYMMKNNRDKILYIGKAKSLKSRIHSYFSNTKQSLKNQFLIQQIHNIDYIVTANEVGAFLLEASLIKKHKPRYNIRLTDDKNYPYIRVSSKDSFPRLYLERRVKDKKSTYFGPYTQGGFVRDMISFTNQNFQLRDCSDSEFKTRKRPCLTHQMGFCSAPCVGLVTAEEYQKQSQKALQFLRGKHQELLRDLNKKMKKYSEELRYEEAGRIKNYIQSIEMNHQSQSVVQESKKDQDVVVCLGDKQDSLIEFLHLRKGRLISHHYSFLSKALPIEENFLSYLNQYYDEHIIPDEVLIQSPLKASQVKMLEKVLQQRKEGPCLVKEPQKKSERLLMDMAESNAQNHFKDKKQQSEDKQELLLEIQKRFHLPELPVRIECYDISHWRGKETVGSQVVFENGEPLKKDYRMYLLQKAPKENDYASLQEVLERRIKHTEYDEPQLILIDGGKGQLRAVQKILEELGHTRIPLVCLAKDRVKEFVAKNSFIKEAFPKDFAKDSSVTDALAEDSSVKDALTKESSVKTKYSSTVHSSGERFYLVGRKNPVIFHNNSKSLHLLLHLRDEAHRFAIGHHKKRRDKDFLKGGLDEISGLGAKRKQALLSHFKTLEVLKKASVEEIASTPTIPKPLALKIKKYCDSI